MAELFALILQLYEDEFLLKAKLTRIEEVRKLVKKGPQSLKKGTLILSSFLHLKKKEEGVAHAIEIGFTGSDRSTRTYGYRGSDPLPLCCFVGLIWGSLGLFLWFDSMNHRIEPDHAHL